MVEEAHEGAATIVVGIDGSSSSKAALAWAARQAKLTGETLHLVTTWDYPTDYGYGWVSAWPENIDFASDAAKGLHDTIKEVLGDDAAITLTETVAEGHPAPILIDLTEHAALIVVGSRGHGSFRGMLLGSVSAHVVTHARCPVVVVHERVDDSNPA